ncbi:hypothetical protein ONZ51_g13083 [Trametes cubensis]|uniref:Endonuclease/exonuclease/phosphatase domain-containing protein n=1 Tax=Trametes cubensis TaxID=1111947 RepID=A0AAD7X456_9APHY|nr:hypothetical protein ONZ51_g13083 [Trametes cubensis]
MWEPDAPHESAKATDLINLMAGWGLGLANSGGHPTHRPHNMALRRTVPDLIWAPVDRIAADEAGVHVDLDGRGLSDHAILHTTMRVGWWEQRLAPTIRRRSEAEDKFIQDIIDGIAGVQVETDSVAGIQRACDAISAIIRTAWDAHATEPRVTSRSKRWWNARCTEARTALRANRTRETRREFKRAVRKAKADYYEERIAAACEKGKRSLVHNGQPLVELQDLWQAAHATYNAAADRPVDMSFLDDIPALEERDWPPISTPYVVDLMHYEQVQLGFSAALPIW